MQTQKLYLKKFINNANDSETRDFKVALEWLKNQEEVTAIYSDKTSSGACTVKDILSLQENENSFIIFSTDNTPILIIGVDDNERKILSPKFFNYSTKKQLTLEEARIAVENGESVIAKNSIFRTSCILKFVDENSFETYSGSIYKIY